MSHTAPAAVSGRMQDGPRPNLSCDETEEPITLAPQPSPASAIAAAAAATAAAIAVATAAAAAAAGAGAGGSRSDASAPSEPRDAGAGGCPQDSKASGLDVLMGAVDIELRAKRAGPAAQDAEATGAVEPDERSTGATTGCSIPFDPAGAGGNACMPAARPDSSSAASPMELELGCDTPEHSPRKAPSEGECGGSGGRPDAYRGDNMEAAACRALRTLPRGFLDHTPNPGSTLGEGGTGSASLPGFSMSMDAAGSTPEAAVATATSAATSSRRRTADCCVSLPESTPSSVVPATSLPSSRRPPLLGPTSRDIYAETVLAVEAARTATTSATASSPGLANEPNRRGVDVNKTVQATAGTPTGGVKTTADGVNAKAVVIKAKAVKAKKVVKSRKAVVKAKKSGVKKKGGKKRKVQARRGPIGQSHFKGVCITPAGTWRAVIYVGRRQKYLGVFDSEFDAARAYDAAAILHFPGATPPLNNPDVVERQLNELSASDGKPFATAGAPELPEFMPPPPGLEEDFGARKRE